MDISIYKNKLLNEGFLNIKLDELYPDLVDTIQIFNNKEEYIQRLSNIQFDSIIFSDITYEYIKSLYCSNSDLINEERINIKEIEGNSHKKFTFKLKLKNPNYKFLYDLNNQLKKISSQVFQSWIDNIKFGDVHPTFTCFQDGDFILSHKDADDTENRCVVLLYLNSDYEDGLGGELIIQNKEVVKPEFGRIAILDFTNNNVIHEVTPVQGNFKRCALISFN